MFKLQTLTNGIRSPRETGSGGVYGPGRYRQLPGTQDQLPEQRWVMLP